ncbi:Mov34/MPN/PAD-1 family protein [Bradyrhizobium sp. CW7]|uniref:Mov34/MPN/PAD-1 family protein n=1 Tax=Bradyrhizobium sp. CW7 TaxID=2782688 RepID=UPI001FFAD270|nr:Mov34/MPN/PAD-1 family protein [Bradyrhizobium sp. CW7]
MDVPVSKAHLTLKVGRISVRIGAQALATFDAHRQRRFFDREAGGQLFARVRVTDWEIVTATGPRLRDRRGRFSFWPHRASEQEEIFENHALGLDYVGDWHTHPEDSPTPSPGDLTSIAEVVRCSTHHLPGFLLMIVGRSPHPEGLWASFHSVEGARIVAEDMRVVPGFDDPLPESRKGRRKS